MRLWSLHPQHLDAKGLVALWREGLLAQKVLRGKTKGYRHHPQLHRFKAHPSPKKAIATYLWEVWKEADRRGYTFDSSKLGRLRTSKKMRVTTGQLRYEMTWLKKKVSQRDPRFYRQLRQQKTRTHPSFRRVPGKVADWEKR